MTKEEREVIEHCLSIYQKDSIEELPDEALIGVFSLIEPPTYGGAEKIYEESDKEERETLIEDIKRCIRGEASMEYYLIDQEGVVKVGGKADFATPHSVWYRTYETIEVR